MPFDEQGPGKPGREILNSVSATQLFATAPRHGIESFVRERNLLRKIRLQKGQPTERGKQNVETSAKSLKTFRGIGFLMSESPKFPEFSTFWRHKCRYFRGFRLSDVIKPDISGDFDFLTS